MATINRGYPELPANVNPDVPHYVNLALRRIDADVQLVDLRMGAALVTAQNAANTAAGVKGQVAAAEDAAQRAAQSAEQAKNGAAANDAGVAEFIKNGPKTSAAIAAALADPAAAAQFELQPLWVTGHSWLGNNSNATPNARFFERVARRLNMGTVTNKGVSGRTVGDIANLTLGGANAWVPRTKALAMLMCTINDVTLFDGSAAGQRSYGHAWRALLAAVTANAAVAANTRNFVYSQGWTNEAVTGTPASAQAVTRNSTGGTQWTTTVPGSFFEFTFSGADVDVFLVAKKAGAGLVSFTEGSTALGTMDLTATMGQDVPAVYRIRNRGTGTHTVRGTLVSGKSLTVDSYRIPSTAPVPVLVLGEPKVIPTATDQASYLADVERYKTDLAAIAAEFPSAHYLDLAAEPGWNTGTMLTWDGKHPHDRGSAWIAGRVQAALSGIPYSTGLNVLSGGYPGAYTAPEGPAIPGGGQSGVPPVVVPEVPEVTPPVEGKPETPVTVSATFDTDGVLSGTATKTGALVWAGSQDLRVIGGEVRMVEKGAAAEDIDRVCVIDPGWPNGTMTATLSRLRAGAPSRTGLVVRYAGATDFITARAYHTLDNGTQFYALWKTVQGVPSLIAESKISPKLGDVMQVSTAGDKISLSVNGKFAVGVTEADMATSTRCGIVANRSDSESAVDNFTYTTG